MKIYYNENYNIDYRIGDEYLCFNEYKKRRFGIKKKSSFFQPKTFKAIPGGLERELEFTLEYNSMQTAKDIKKYPLIYAKPTDKAYSFWQKCINEPDCMYPWTIDRRNMVLFDDEVCFFVGDNMTNFRTNPYIPPLIKGGFIKPISVFKHRSGTVMIAKLLVDVKKNETNLK